MHKEIVCIANFILVFIAFTFLEAVLVYKDRLMHYAIITNRI